MREQPVIVGITGGIGSGKTLVAEIVSHCGYPVYNADEQAKKCIHEDERLQSDIIDLLGPESFAGGTYNRPYVSQQVFNNNDLLERLNQIIHPAVQKNFSDWLSKQHSTLVFKEAAILYEAGADQGCDKVIVVAAPEDVRIQRVVERDQVSQEEVRSRMAKQWPQDKKEALADYVINNDGSRFLIPQVIDTIQQILLEYEIS